MGVQTRGVRACPRVIVVAVCCCICVAWIPSWWWWSTATTANAEQSEFRGEPWMDVVVKTREEYARIYADNPFYRAALREPIPRPRPKTITVSPKNPFMKVLKLRKQVSFKAWPVNYAIPEALFNKDARKTKAFGTVIPGDMSTYVFAGKKDEYFADYAASYYAITMKKHGWDCFRNAEILSQGAAPYLTSMSLLSEHTMFFLPRKIVGALMNLPGVRVRYTRTKKMCCDTIQHHSIDWKVFDPHLYHAIHQLLMDHLERYYTTTAMVKYMLRVTKQTHAKRFLWINDVAHPKKKHERGMKWAGCGIGLSTQHGFKTLFGDSFVIDPEPMYLYTDYPPTARKPKLGQMWTMTIDPSKRSQPRKESMEARIASKEFDVVIYGTSNDHISYLSNKPYWDVVSKHYRGNTLWYVDGSDGVRKPTEPNPAPFLVRAMTPFASLGHTVFMREL